MTARNMNASRKIRNNLSDKKMGKIAKLYRPVKSKDVDQFVVRFKHLDKQQIKDVRAALVKFVAEFQFEKLSDE